MLMSGLKTLNKDQKSFSKDLTDENFIPNPENQINHFLREVERYVYIIYKN
jgi:hypothetical protein